MKVLTCSGPMDRSCPVMVGEPCPLVAGADVVVVADHGPAVAWQRLLQSRARLNPGVPIYFEPSRLDTAAGGSDPTCPIVTAAGVVSFVQRLACQRHERD